jgi:hypothetical protein
MLLVWTRKVLITGLASTMEHSIGEKG